MARPVSLLPSAQNRGVNVGVDVNLNRDQAGKQRRKIQNRKNQRAHRLRAKDQGEESVQTPRPFHVERWRLDEQGDDTTYGLISNTVEDTSTTHIVPRAPHDRIGTEFYPGYRIHTPSRDQIPLTPPPLIFPLSTDHLLHLVQYNVFRAFVSNKRTLNVLLTGWTKKPPSPATCPIGGPYRDDTMVYPLNPNIPVSLVPTSLQQSRMHSLWINFIPFPRVRDNLIKREGSFDHWELFQDLIGELISFTPVSQRRDKSDSFTVSDPKSKSISSLCSERDGDELTAGRNGLIVWGEPHDMESWEATPRFLEKWSWAVEGCSDLIECTNRWRQMRGEEAIPFRKINLQPSNGANS
ncbi:hypothetical protein SVAN01_07938 [Stagonosporopsis vannaccii]|nr:hypothetical protein SVAN01_07938 [Stagonosporopsis vannaccii]